MAVDNSVHLVGASHGVHVVMAKDGEEAPEPDAMVCGLQFAWQVGAFVVNISSVIPPYTPLTDQIHSAYYWHGMLIVASADNSSGGAVGYPANLPEVMAVTAVDSNNQRAAFAAIGPEIELAAPGVDLRTLRHTALATGCSWGGNVYVAVCSGTSFAAPHVAAAAAVLKGFEPFWSNVAIRERLQQTAASLGPPTHYGYGLLDIRAALDWRPPLPPPGPYSVTISGPPEISPTATCTWLVEINAGQSTPPYTYEWRRDGQFVSMQDHYIGSMNGDESFELSVTVTSSEGWPESDPLTVTDTGFGECLAL